MTPVSKNVEVYEGQENILTICDELHLHKDNNTYQILFLGQANTPLALTSAISTAGFNLTSYGYEHYKFCMKILDSIVDKDSQFVYIAEPDPGDDPWDYKTWMKANPLQLFEDDDITPNEVVIKRYRDIATTARAKGGKELTSFLTKLCDIWCDRSEDALVDMEAFLECRVAKDLEDMRGADVYIGLDLSNSNDLTSYTILVKDKTTDHVFAHSKGFMPSERLNDHERTDDVPYRVWEKRGLLVTTDTLGGLKTDHNYVFDDLLFTINHYDLHPVGFGYDPYGVGALIKRFDEELPCPATAISQSAASLSEAIADFQATVKAGMFEFNQSNQLYAWSASNARLKINDAGQMKPMKAAVGRRIDLIASTLDAWKLMIADAENYTTEDALEDYLTLLSNARRDHVESCKSKQ